MATEQTALDRIIAALEAIAENTDDKDTRTSARKILDGFAGAGRSIGITTRIDAKLAAGVIRRHPQPPDDSAEERERRRPIEDRGRRHPA